MPPTPILCCKNLCRIGRDSQYLLNNINCNIFPNQRIVLQGKAGSGKSLLLRALARLDLLETGELLLLGTPVVGIPVTDYRTQVLLIGQHTTLVNGTVEDNLMLPFSFAQHSDLHYDKNWVNNELAFFQKPTNFLQRDSQTLSGGERQIVNLLRGLQLNPTLLLLDEPTAALDADTARLLEARIQTWLASLAEQRAYLWISHDEAQSLRVGDIFWHIQSGNLTC